MLSIVDIFNRFVSNVISKSNERYSDIYVGKFANTYVGDYFVKVSILNDGEREIEAWKGSDRISYVVYRDDGILYLKDEIILLDLIVR